MIAAKVFYCPITCLSCGGPLTLLNSRAMSSHSVAILECDPCEREWEFTACLRYHAVSQKAVARQDAAKRVSNARARERETVSA